MEIKELNKTQLILLSLLITFVVSIATGIVTVSLMQQAPKSVPQTINNVIQRTIEKVTTVQVPAPISTDKIINDNKKNIDTFLGDGDVVVSIYSADEVIIDNSIGIKTETTVDIPIPKDDVVISDNSLGQGVIISDVGLILVESTILEGHHKYKVILGDKEFNVSVLKKFENGFTILRINSNQEAKDSSVSRNINTDKVDTTTPEVDNH